MDGLSHIDVFIYATFKKLNFFNLHFSDVAYYLFSVHFGMPDHTHLKWLNKDVTIVDPKSHMTETYRALNYFRKKTQLIFDCTYCNFDLHSTKLPQFQIVQNLQLNYFFSANVISK